METYQFVNQESLDQFHKMLLAKTRNGFVIIEHNEKLPYAVLSKEKKEINHPLHLFLACITFGLWSIVWIYLSITLSRKKDILVALDEDGNLFEDKCLSKK
ncbi:hypothetical protein BC749_101802 [Flavobacterium araucananum]|jgi:hypothetical protein|uniref:Uncharacterized protein n=1 Tax=Flavobacterium araucananum TaxID=946678 RepID=A0A227PJQ0_9FLAO|nr:hypothetical protein [Flavobacterium araucananum]OXG09356.1 hypothetical protein B0A64_00905 [Flavobacterium araucananum]PWK02729.1 hypothetical protein BC749_101802 [Flavobacterium araucananum]